MSLNVADMNNSQILRNHALCANTNSRSVLEDQPNPSPQRNEHTRERHRKNRECFLSCAQCCCCGCLQHPVRQRKFALVHCWLVQVFVFLLHLPCAFIECIRQGVRHTRNNNLSEREICRDEPICEFGDSSRDVTDGELAQYKGKVMHLLDGNLLSRTYPAWQSIAKELTDVCENGFIIKLQTWLNCLGEDSSDDIHQLFVDLSATAIVRRQKDVVITLLEYLPNISMKFVSNEQHYGLTPFHLAIATKQVLLACKMMSLCDNDADKLSRLLHLAPTTDCTHIRKLSPCGELPLNLGVWTGDVDIVQASD